MISLKELNTLIGKETINAIQHKQLTIPLNGTLGQILAEDIQSAVAIPPVDVSAMDGYAFVGGTDGVSAGTTLTLIGDSIAGNPFTGKVGEGECVRIMTGAIVPDGADSVEMQEYIQADGCNITFSRHGKPHNNIRYSGEELSKGETVMQAGQIISPTDILLLASVGCGEVPVYAPLKVAVFSTGDELAAPGSALKETGQIYDSNRAMIKALLSDLPVKVIDYGLINDDLERIKATLAQAAAECDVIITSGGVSVGDYDFLKAAVSELGEIRQYKVKMKPGKPFVYGRVDQAWYFGLPGNPVSGFVGFTQIIAPSLWQLAGAEAPPTLTMNVPLSAALHKSPGRQDFQRGLLTQHNGVWQVSPQGRQDSHRIYGLARANCFIVLEANDGDKTAGEYVTVVPFTNRFTMGGHL